MGTQHVQAGKVYTLSISYISKELKESKTGENEEVAQVIISSPTDLTVHVGEPFRQKRKPAFTREETLLSLTLTLPLRTN